MKALSAIVGTLLLVLVTPSVYCQEAAADSQDQYEPVFKDVQRGISTGNAGLLGRHFAPHVAMHLRDNEQGTYSSSQSYYLLEDFFRLRRFDRFEFSTIAGPDATPYATGETEFIQRGNKEIAQVYVALSFNGKKYVITQLTIY